MERHECAVCRSKIVHVHAIENMPIKLCCVDSPEYNKSSLSFAICQICCTIQLDKLLPLEILYSSSHNTVSVGKTWDNYFNKFCKTLKGIVENKNVLEIGDPSCKVANVLNNYKEWNIIEPNKNKNITCKENIHFIEGFFDETFNIDSKIDVITHSHVFEHIYSPNVFLKKCWDILNDDGEMFFGIPNMEHIKNEGMAPCIGIFFEHTLFLNKENVRYMLEKNGFTIVSIIDYENHSILYHVKKSIMPERVDIIPIDNCLDVFLTSLKNWQTFAANIDDTYEVYIFGASYNTQYLLTLGLADKKIAGILDNCKEKQGKYLYGYSLYIYSPTVVIGKKCVVVVKSGYYSNEIIEQLRLLNNEIIIIQ